MPEPRLASNLRGFRYGEVFVAYLEGERRIEVFNSFPLNDCPQELWGKLNVAVLAEECEATAVILNGPRYWMMDGIGKVDPVAPVLRNFGGIEMRCVATLEIDGPLDRLTYTERNVNRGAIWYFDEGKSVHELLAPNGKTYVMQAYCVGVDPSLNQENLHELAERLQLPEGWKFRTRILEEELLIDTTARWATVLQDEYENTYTLV